MASVLKHQSPRILLPNTPMPASACTNDLTLPVWNPPSARRLQEAACTPFCAWTYGDRRLVNAARNPFLIAPIRPWHRLYPLEQYRFVEMSSFCTRGKGNHSH